MIFTRTVLEMFEELLRQRLERLNPQDLRDRLTEDEIQDSLNHALITKGGIAEYEIRMEFEHPFIPGKKLDSYIAPALGRPAAAWEVKYDRRPPSGVNSPRSNKAGGVINDVFRLAALHRDLEIETVVVYVTDQEMAGYYANADNHFGSFFDLAVGKSFAMGRTWIEFLSGAVKSRLRAPGDCCHVLGKYSADLPRDHALRVYEVAPGDPTEARLGHTMQVIPVDERIAKE
jgi:hypothetical protein